MNFVSIIINHFVICNIILLLTQNQNNHFSFSQRGLINYRLLLYKWVDLKCYMYSFLPDFLFLNLYF